jgi:hypothetical protein
VKPRKPIRKKTKKRLTKQAVDLLVRDKIIFPRDEFRCVVPEKYGYGRHGGNLQSAHVFPKGVYQNIRFDPHNLFACCWLHHSEWWHKNPIEAFHWFSQAYPDRYEYLMSIKDASGKVDLKNLVAELERQK